ncbi:MAG: hypothetical protein KDA60_15475, partial [Planctomycetales bacterium]|nr:hypothetical protein [Planctomycetales bacterium]
AAKHVRPVIFVDQELDFVPEKNAPGIEKLRGQLKQALANRDAAPSPHEEIIKLVDEAGQDFHILMIKTDLTLPYTSVFIRLDAGYWSAEAEEELRETINKEQTSSSGLRDAPPR